MSFVTVKVLMRDVQEQLERLGESYPITLAEALGDTVVAFKDSTDKEIAELKAELARERMLHNKTRKELFHKEQGRLDDQIDTLKKILRQTLD